MAFAHNDPIYPISVAAKILDAHPHTLRLYEVEGLIYPKRQRQKRFFSDDIIGWIQCLRELIHQEGISIPDIKRLLFLAPCWEIASTACSKILNHCTFCEIRKPNRTPGRTAPSKH